jgi:hypothetical protein
VIPAAPVQNHRQYPQAGRDLVLLGRAGLDKQQIVIA